MLSVVIGCRLRCRGSGKPLSSPLALTALPFPASGCHCRQNSVMMGGGGGAVFFHSLFSDPRSHRDPCQRQWLHCGISAFTRSFQCRHSVRYIPSLCPIYALTQSFQCLHSVRYMPSLSPSSVNMVLNVHRNHKVY